MRTISDVLNSLPRPSIDALEAPAYSPEKKERNRRIFLGAEAMSRHTADAGWQLTLGFKEVGYELWGARLDNPEINVTKAIATDPTTIVVQDKREWEGKTAKYRSMDQAFRNISALRCTDRIFKLTILKDAQQRPFYHRESAEEIGAHAWITYYHPRIVKHVAPYVREEHLIRHYHTVDSRSVPPYSPERKDKALLSGAVSNAYPLRSKFKKMVGVIPNLDIIHHPGYHARGCVTPEYLKKLSSYKVAICTSSRYGYSLRKIIEATACGCKVITDLPVDDVLPEIDANLVRLPPGIGAGGLEKLIGELVSNYDPGLQLYFASLAKNFYDYRIMAIHTAAKIERMRNEYPTPP